MSGTSEPVQLIRYILQFAGIYLVAIIAVIAVTTLLKFDTPSAMGIIVLIAASSGVAQSFVKNTKRVMEKSERVTLATAGTAITTLLSFLWVWVATSIDPAFASEIRPMLQDSGFLPILIGIVIFAILLSWAVIYFTLGFFGKSALKRMEASVR
jgi:hypothetical protein